MNETTALTNNSRTTGCVEDLIPAPRRSSRRLKIPVRYGISVLAFIGFANIYALRCNLSIAIVEMTSEKEVTLQNGTTSHVKEFNWTPNQKGMLLSSFYWGYLVTQIPGGMLTARYGGKNILALAVLSTSIFTILTPLCVQIGGFRLLICLRILIGFVEGVSFAAAAGFWSKWAPRLETSILWCITISGTDAGMVVAMPLGGALGYYMNWQSIFYVFGIMGVVWFFLWSYFVTNTPEEHPYIELEELEHIQISRKTSSSTVRTFSELPWKSLLSTPAVWAAGLASCCENWGFITMLTELPTFMADVLKLNLDEIGLLSGLPYLTTAIVLQLSSQVVDFARRRDYMSTTNIRKVCVAVGFTGQIIFFLLISTGQTKSEVIFYLTMAVGLSGISMSAIMTNSLDLSPRYACLVMAFVNIWANLSGVLTPVVTGALVTNGTAKEWSHVFITTSILYVIGGIFYLLFGSGDIQPWTEET